MSEPTEEPTPKRLRKAREDGDSPLSTFASQAAAFAAAVAVLPTTVPALATHAAADLRGAMARVAEASPSVVVDCQALATSLVMLAAPIVLTAAVTSAIVSMVQTGGVVATKRLTPDLAKLDAIAGLRRLVSTDRLVTVLRAFVFAGAVLWVTYVTMRDHARDLARATGRVDAAAVVSGALALSVAERALAMGLVLAAIDIVVTRRSWLRRLRMTKADVKREHKESEGDPQLKSARERAHHEVLAAVAVANVKKASVVVVNPTHLACALEYDETAGHEAPIVVASGRGELARRIVEAANHYGVPVLQDVPLARALVELEIGDEIPEVLYQAVAEILREAWGGDRPPEP
jgi:flagellar biosynthesis protein FlhB